MSKARDIANILSANTAIATDAEVASSVSSAVSTHATASNGHIGRGTTEQRPSSPAIGDTYFDTTLSALISYKSAGWEKVSQDPAPQIASISPTTAGTTGTTITITGSSFKSGLLVQFIGADATSYNAPVATFVNATTATATTPVLSVANEPYDVKVINNDNQFAILDDALDAGGSPTWNTASGTIATIAEQTALNVSVSATDPDGTSIIYSSSDLPVATPTPVSFEVTNSGYGAYNMNGSPNAAITLVRGGTYTFNVNASGHPFYIQTTGNGYNAYNVYSTGVTGAGAQVGTVTFVVPNDAPNTLFYQCQYHPAMFGQINVVNATAWVTLNPSTGSLTGTAPDVSADTTYNFNVTASDGVNTSSRAFSIAVNAITYFSVDYLIVGGGGSGGMKNSHGGGAGGGGAGGLLTSTSTQGGGVAQASPLNIFPSTNYSVAVGQGGFGSVNDSTAPGGNSGGSSIFSSLTALGGGKGGSQSNYSALDGGSGGGAGGAGGGASRTPGNGSQGYAGGGAQNSYPYPAGGGGGAGGAGTISNGGIGIQNNISGVATYYAGGGGGNGDANNGSGGAGGGGNGHPNKGQVTSGTANTGGGGGASNNNFGASNGGSGIVILKYPDNRTITFGSGVTGTESSAGAGYKKAIITSGSGNVAWA